MFKRSSLFLFVLFGLISIFNFTASAQETESAANSALTEAKLPSGAVRILPGSVPAEINQGLEKIVAAGEGKIVQGDSEVLAWTGAGYKKSNAANLMKQIQSNLQAKGWSYETGEKTDEVTVFSALRETPKKQGVLGFYVMSDDAMVLAWTEILPAGGSKNTVENDSPKSEPIKQSPLQNQNSSRSSNSSSIVGEWHNGRVSMMQDKNLITGQMTASNGSTFTYKFSPTDVLNTSVISNQRCMAARPICSTTNAADTKSAARRLHSFRAKTTGKTHIAVRLRATKNAITFWSAKLTNFARKPTNTAKLRFVWQTQKAKAATSAKKDNFRIYFR
jgi:hypothetical protein